MRRGEKRKEERTERRGCELVVDHSSSSSSSRRRREKRREGEREDRFSGSECGERDDGGECL